MGRASGVHFIVGRYIHTARIHPSVLAHTAQEPKDHTSVEAWVGSVAPVWADIQYYLVVLLTDAVLLLVTHLGRMLSMIVLCELN